MSDEGLATRDGSVSMCSSKESTIITVRFDLTPWLVNLRSSAGYRPIMVKGGELSYMALALQREQTACTSLLMLARAVMAEPEPMLARLVPWYGAASPWPSLLAWPLMHACHRLADAVKGGELSYMALALEREQTICPRRHEAPKLSRTVPRGAQPMQPSDLTQSQNQILSARSVAVLALLPFLCYSFIATVLRAPSVKSWLHLGPLSN